MPRSPVTFQNAFDAFCRRLNYTPAQIVANATLQASVLEDFNEVYQVGLDLPGDNGWDDARVGAEITPEDGNFIDFATIGDARAFDLWTASPRTTTPGQRLESPRDWTPDEDGILLRGTYDTIWMSWVPVTAEFTTTAWVTSTSYAVGDRVLYTNGHNYRCLTTHTSGTFGTDLAAGKWVLLPVLAVLKQFLIDYAQGTYLIRNGSAETGVGLQNRALAALETRAMDEIARNNRVPLNPTYCFAYPSAGSAVTARYLEWPSGLTGLTGGGTTNLDGLATTSYTTGKLVCFAISAQFQVWELQAVSTAEDPTNGIVRPDDYDATSNQRTWIRIA